MYRQYSHPTSQDLFALQGDFERSLNNLYDRNEDIEVEDTHDHYDADGNLILDFEENPLFDL